MTATQVDYRLYNAEAVMEQLEIHIPNQQMREVQQGRCRAVRTMNKDIRPGNVIDLVAGSTRQPVVVTHIGWGDIDNILTVMPHAADKELPPLHTVPFERLSSQVAAYSQLPMVFGTDGGVPTDIIIPTAVGLTVLPEGTPLQAGGKYPYRFDVTFVNPGLQVTVPFLADFNSAKVTKRDVDTTKPDVPLIDKLRIVK